MQLISRNTESDSVGGKQSQFLLVLAKASLYGLLDHKNRRSFYKICLLTDIAATVSFCDNQKILLTFAPLQTIEKDPA